MLPVIFFYKVWRWTGKIHHTHSLMVVVWILFLEFHFKNSMQHPLTIKSSEGPIPWECPSASLYFSGTAALGIWFSKLSNSKTQGEKLQWKRLENMTCGQANSTLRTCCCPFRVTRSSLTSHPLPTVLVKAPKKELCSSFSSPLFLAKPRRHSLIHGRVIG